MSKTNVVVMTLLIGIGSCAVGALAGGRQPTPLMPPVESAAMLRGSVGEGERSAIAESQNLREVIVADAAEIADLRGLFGAKYGRRAETLLTGDGVASSRIFGIPGVIRNARLAANPNNENLAKGALRSHLYARKIFGDNDFELTAMNEPLRTPAGKTDADILFRNRLTGETFRMEVKQVEPRNILKNLEKYKLQVDKMAEDKLISGRRQLWVNRYGAPPGFRGYAESRGVDVYENVGTGEKSALKPGATPFQEILERLRTPMQGPELPVAAINEGEDVPVGPISRMSSDSAALETADAGELLSPLGETSVAAADSLDGALARTGVIAGVGLEAVTDVFSIYEYNTGRMTNRQMVTQIKASAIFFTFTAGGASLGFFAGGIGAVPGAITGMGIGALAQTGYSLYNSRREVAGWLRGNDYSPNRLAGSMLMLAKQKYYGGKHIFERQFGVGMPGEQRDLLNFLEAHYAHKIGD